MKGNKIISEKWAIDTEIEAEVEKKKGTENVKDKDKDHEVQEIVNIQIKTMIDTKEKTLRIPNNLGSQRQSK